MMILIDSKHLYMSMPQRPATLWASIAPVQVYL